MKNKNTKTDKRAIERHKDNIPSTSTRNYVSTNRQAHADEPNQNQQQTVAIVHQNNEVDTSSDCNTDEIATRSTAGIGKLKKRRNNNEIEDEADDENDCDKQMPNTSKLYHGYKKLKEQNQILRSELEEMKKILRNQNKDLANSTNNLSNTAYNINTSNRYTDLEDMEDDDITQLNHDNPSTAVENDTDFPSITTVVNTEGTTSNTTAVHNMRKPGKVAPITKFIRNKDIPPITLFNVNHKELSNYLLNELKHKNFQINCENSNKTLLFMANYDDFLHVKRLLIQKKVKFFTHLTSSEKQSQYIIKGISASFDAQDITQEIKYNFPNLPTFEIHKFESASATAAKRSLNLWVIKFNEKDFPKFINLFNTNYLLYSKIKIEPYNKTSNKLIQCRNCLRFGHGTQNCHMPFRCPKCASSDHIKGKCPLEEKNGKNEIESLKCANCKENGHPASYRGCSKYQEILARKTQKMQEASNRTQYNINSSQRTNVSYAQASKKSTNNNNANNRSVNNNNANSDTNNRNYNVQDDYNEFIINNIFNIIKLIEEHLPRDKFIRMSNIEKNQALVKLALSIVHRNG